jgi:hypothetical protein
MEDVVSALHNTLGKKGMSDGDNRKLAEYLMSFFGYADEIIDNRLTSEDRDVFYMLEEEGFLTTTQEEVHLNMTNLQEAIPQKNDDNSAVYDEISEEMWNGHK